MKLTKIGYNSAAIFGVFSLIMYLVVGMLQWSLRDVLIAQGIEVNALQTFLVAPVIGGIVGYLVVLIGIVLYNFVAKKYPISWEVAKK
jgi:hypothetical protein